MSDNAHFSPALFAFLRELKKHNDRDWFNANKARYEEHVKEPLLRFISDVAPSLHAVSAHVVADPRPVGGSMFRIYRDTRFSKDKTPYKTAASAHFRHDAGTDVHAPGYYLHLEPGQCFAGAGVWGPDGAALGKIRDAIVEKSAAWKRITAAKGFRERFAKHEHDTLKRPPAGYDPAHPHIEDLKRKSFTVGFELDEKLVCSAKFLPRFVEACRTAAPFMKFLSNALELPF